MMNTRSREDRLKVTPPWSELFRPLPIGGGILLLLTLLWIPWSLLAGRGGLPFEPWKPNDWPWAALLLAAASASILALAVSLRSLGRQRNELLGALRRERQEVENRHGEVARIRRRLAEEEAGRHEAERLRRELEERVLQTQKLESLGVMAGGIAHDFNNLLMGILGSASLAQKEAPREGKIRHLLDNIVRTSDRAANLCRQMLLYSSRVRPLRDLVDLNEVSAEIRSLMEISVSKKIELRTDFAEDLPACEGDAGQIRQLIMNLILNGAEAIGAGRGIVTLRTGSAAGVGGVGEVDETSVGGSGFSTLCGSPPPGPYVFLEVVDSGEGMDRATLEKALESAYSTRAPGRGLGLAAVAAIVRGHGGEIRARSRPGAGTTIQVLLPALATTPVAVGEAPSPKLSGEIPSGRVLVVDDEETVREVAAEMLSQAGFEVLTAADGREAVELYRLRHREISCVLLDLTMPHMDGVETLGRLRAIQPRGKIILSSGYGFQEVSEELCPGGATAFLQKPYDCAEIQRTVGRVIATEG